MRGRVLEPSAKDHLAVLRQSRADRQPAAQRARRRPVSRRGEKAGQAVADRAGVDAASQGPAEPRRPRRRQR